MKTRANMTPNPAILSANILFFFPEDPSHIFLCPLPSCMGHSLLHYLCGWLLLRLYQDKIGTIQKELFLANTFTDTNSDRFVCVTCLFLFLH